MKIKLRDGTEYHLDIYHEYDDQWVIDTLHDHQALLCAAMWVTDAMIEKLDSDMLRCGNEDVAPVIDLSDLRDGLSEEISKIKGEITVRKKYPIKTHAILEQPDGGLIEAFASISKEDADKFLHCRKKGRSVALRNLLKACATAGLSKDTRTELAQKLLPSIK